LQSIGIRKIRHFEGSETQTFTYELNMTTQMPKGFGLGNKNGYKHGKSRTPEYVLFHGAKGRAKKQGVEFSIGLEDIVIPEKCPILGIPLFPNHTGKAKPGPNSPTLDRRDNDQGYTKANTWVVSFRANSLKSDATVAELRAMARNVQVGKLVYLASPYTHKNPAMCEARFVEAVLCCGWMMTHQKDTYFYSPIAHTHPVALRVKLPIEWQFWAAFDECVLSRCSEIWILCSPGWTKSTGVKAERLLAEKFGLPIRFVIVHPENPADSEQRYEVTDVEPEDNYVAQYFS
jgi:hypothetical protein